MGTLTITYSEPGRKPLSVATISDPRLLRDAAAIAISEADARVAAAGNMTARKLYATEARRLRDALSVLIPGLMVAVSASTN